MAAEHSLAHRTSISLEMISDFQHSDTEGPAYWKDGFVPARTRRGRAIERGPVVGSTEELLALISGGEIVNLFPRHMTRYWARPDIAYLPVDDMDALPFAAAWRTESENDLIRAFVQIVRDLGPRDLDAA